MQLAMHMVTIEDLMPQGHFLRKLEAALDLSFVYEETAPLYSKKYGRPAIDPVVIVKYLLVGFLYGIPSERQIERRVQTDIALRWSLGLDLFDRVPDHSTISQLRRRKPSFRKVFRRLFEEVVGQCVEKGLVSGRVIGTDSTHVRANKFSIAISTTTLTIRHGRVLPVRARLSELYPVVKRFSVTAALQAKPGEVVSCDANRLSLPCSNHCQGSIHNQE